MPANQQSLRLLDLYHDRLVSVRERTAQVVDGLYRGLDTSDLGVSFQGFVRDAARAITAGQTNARLLSDVFLTNYIGASTGEKGDLEEPVPDNEGFTTDGRRLTDAMGAIPAKVFLAIKQGQPMGKALAYGRFASSRFVLTEVMDAANQELTHQMDALDKVKGWRWKSRGTCGACLASDNGRVYPTSKPLNRHPNCQCVSEPVVDGVKERVPRETGIERFKSMPEAEQDKSLGKGLADLVRKSAIAWTDLISHENPHEWHPLVVVTTLKEAMNN